MIDEGSTAVESGTATGQDQRGREAEPLEPLLDSNDAEQFHERWQSIQVTFVDEPRDSVEKADALVSELMEHLAQTFQQERRSLEAELEGDDVSTDDLRVALKRYRSFFERLLST
jgi:uncharacterized Ntn-hydrolase superfamily protein